ncbi:cytosine permease [Streptomyces canus]|uniref:cytosine permease n=1 Tax=Streptomyces canus TaxID=58343 RepID=UPI0036B552BA
MLVGSMLVSLVGADGSIAGLTSILPGPVEIFVLLMLFVGAIDAAVINLYGPSLCTLTLIQTFLPAWEPRSAARNIVAVITVIVTSVVALRFADDFLVNYFNFIYLLMGLLIPWSVINLVDHYLIKKGEYDPQSFTALITYALGFLVQLPFMNGALVKGPVGDALGGVDLSWAVGSVASFVIYLALVRVMPSQDVVNVTAPLGSKAS